MRDGVNISLDIYRPVDKGQFPTLYAAAPYPHNDDENIPDSPLTGSVASFVRQGYNYVLASTRGTGLSEGSYQLLSRDEQQDHYEIIEWIAAQDWSNGKVAGAGASYYSTAQWQMAIQNPPHLSCIAPFNGVLQPYQDWAFPGGLASTAFSMEWYKQKVRLANAFPGSGLAKIVEFDLDLQLLLHPQYDDFWRLRTSLENINEISVPIFIIRTWDQNEPGLSGTFKTLERINSIHKLLLFGSEQDSVAYQNQAFLEQELFKYYDWCFADDQSDRRISSFIEQPRIRYYVRGSEQLKRENSWPPGNTSTTPLFLNRQALDASEAGTLNFSSLQNSFGVSQYGSGSENSSVIFFSNILEQDMEISGPISLKLYASSSTNETAFEVIFSEQFIAEKVIQAPTLTNFLLDYNKEDKAALTVNSEVMVSSGSLKTPRINPGEIDSFDILLQASSYRFKKGNRLKVEIRKTDDGSLSSKSSQETIFHSTQYPTQLLLPLTQSLRANSEASAQSL